MQQKSASLEEKEKLENHVYAGVVELADTPDLGSGAGRRAGSSPVRRTKTVKTYTLYFRQ